MIKSFQGLNESIFLSEYLKRMHDNVSKSALVGITQAWRNTLSQVLSGLLEVDYTEFTWFSKQQPV